MESTDEQVEAIAAFRMGLLLRIQAGAGTGKTSTLRQMGLATRRVGQYTAFNRAIVGDAAAAMPANVACATAHSLAMRQTGKMYRWRLDSKRMRSQEVARKLRLDPLTLVCPGGKKVLQPGMLASLAQNAITRFCQTADPAPTVEHVRYLEGIDPKDADGRRTWTNNNIVREHLRKALEVAWADIVDSKAGELRFTHDHYLKIWQLGVGARDFAPEDQARLFNSPNIPGDFILFDEAQDASPVMLDAVMQQAAQLIVVGDSQQAIYEWRGAVDALEQVPAEATAFLTKSWRFGPRIAEVANLVLEMLDADLRLTGCDVASEVRLLSEDPRAVLCRTNSESVTTVLNYQREGISVHLVGGGDEVASFARAVKELEETGSTWHPELACFYSFKEVKEYVDQDPQGGELALLVKLVEEFGVDVILKALDHMPREEQARVIVSTAHKAKGREWPTVRLASDFPEPEGDNWQPEFRLLYVAATRGREVLDPMLCETLHGLIDPEWKARKDERATRAFERPLPLGWVPEREDDDEEAVGVI